MSFASYSRPNRRQMLLGTVLGLAGLIAAPQLLALLPPREPMWVDASTIVSQIMPSGRWRVERDNTVREVCRSVTIRRFFRGDLAGEPAADISMPAATSSRPTLEPVFASSMSRIGTFHNWWEYEPVPGFKGSYIVTAAAADCDSGYNGVFTLYVVPVDWTGIQPPQRR